jgi:hypothetical protein
MRVAVAGLLGLLLRVAVADAVAVAASLVLLRVAVAALL